MAKYTKYGKNHKKEEILKIYSEKCPQCNVYMRYTEFMFNVLLPGMESGLNEDMVKLVNIQQLEDLAKNIEDGKKIEILGMLIGCYDHYATNSKAKVDKMINKPYITLDPEDVFRFNNISISHIYLAAPIN